MYFRHITISNRQVRYLNVCLLLSFLEVSLVDLKQICKIYSSSWKVVLAESPKKKKKKMATPHFTQETCQPEQDWIAKRMLTQTRQTDGTCYNSNYKIMRHCS